MSEKNKDKEKEGEEERKCENRGGRDRRETEELCKNVTRRKKQRVRQRDEDGYTFIHIYDLSLGRENYVKKDRVPQPPCMHSRASPREFPLAFPPFLLSALRPLFRERGEPRRESSL